MNRQDEILLSLGWYPLRVATRREPTEADLSQLEDRLGARLPDSFRYFLCRYGEGALALHGCFPILEPCSWGQWGIIDQFLGFSKKPNEGLLSTNFDIFAGRIPEGMLTFAYDPGGNLLLLNIKGIKPAGTVWFWDHECRPRNIKGELTENNLYLVADSFTQFIESLRTGMPDS
jgi:SMI1 / KNR4 family (SUKH-1)